MTKFKEGHQAYHITKGLVILKENDNEFFPISIRHGTHFATFTSDGFLNMDDKHPTLLTLEEAKLRGYEVPEQPREFWFNFYSMGARSFHKTHAEADEFADEFAGTEADTYGKRIGQAVKFVEEK